MTESQGSVWETMIQLFQLIHVPFGIDTPPITLTDEECDSIIALSARQSILPILYAGMKKTSLTGVSEEKQKEIDKARLKDMRRYILHLDALRKIGAALEKEFIPYIPLKGSVLRNLYPSPEMRTSCDIDMLVREEDLERAVVAIEQATDFKSQKRNYHDISMVNQNVHLELHFSIQENMDNIDKLLTRVWENAVQADGYRYNLKYAELNEYLELPRGTFSSWKAGRSRNYCEHIGAIANYLNVDVKWLVTGELSEGAINLEEQELLGMFRRLDEEKQKAILQNMKWLTE